MSIESTKSLVRKLVQFLLVLSLRQSTGSVFAGFITQTILATYNKKNFDSSSTESKVMVRVGFVHILRSSLRQVGLK